MDELKPFISDIEIEEKTLEFLKKYHNSFEIPIPIEDIVEIKMELEIIPLPRLWEDFKIDGFLNSDLDTITVAQFHFEKNINRYRFTLAHEVGHLVLHSEYIQSQNIENYEDWKNFSIEREKPHSIIETQANIFAGFLLMPSAEMESVYLQEKKSLFEIYPKIAHLDDFKLAPYISNSLAKQFEVSDRVAQIRLERWLIKKDK